MKETHVELQFKEELLKPLNRLCGNRKDEPFTSFWKICVEKSGKGKSLDDYSNMLSEYAEKTWSFHNAFKEFHEFLKSIPLIVALRHWIEGAMQDHLTAEKSLLCMQRLLVCDLIVLNHPSGTAITLFDMRARGHQDIVNNIRCVQTWTQSEKEEIVQCYIRFSCDLAKYTFNYLPEGYDPDRKLTNSRLISYEVFYSFIQHLSKRDALLSKVLYFGAPTLDEVLLLQIQFIDKERCSIQFKEKTEVFPKHLIQDLVSYAQDNTNPKGFVFANLRGEPVERAHLNQSFARASKKLPQDVKITPGSLLRFRF